MNLKELIERLKALDIQQAGHTTEVVVHEEESNRFYDIQNLDIENGRVVIEVL